MKKLIAVMALAGLFAVGCAHNKGGTSEGNYSTSDTSSGEQGKMQNYNSQTNNATPSQPSSESNTNSNSSTSTPQQPQ